MPNGYPALPDPTGGYPPTGHVHEVLDTEDHVRRSYDHAALLGCNAVGPTDWQLLSEDEPPGPEGKLAIDRERNTDAPLAYADIVAACTENHRALEPNLKAGLAFAFRYIDEVDDQGQSTNRARSHYRVVSDFLRQILQEFPSADFTSVGSGPIIDSMLRYDKSADETRSSSVTKAELRRGINEFLAGSLSSLTTQYGELPITVYIRCAMEHAVQKDLIAEKNTRSLVAGYSLPARVTILDKLKIQLCSDLEYLRATGVALNKGQKAQTGFTITGLRLLKKIAVDFKIPEAENTPLQ